MAFDSSTLCARTSAGDAELATPRLGLSLGQRRVLSLLQDPAVVAELAQKHRLEPDKLARDLTRLAQLRVVVLHGPGITPEPVSVVPQTRTSAASSMAPVVIGHSARRAPTLPLAAGAAAIVLAVGIWYGTRTSESTTAKQKSPAVAPAPQPVATLPAPTAPTASTVNDAAPVNSTAVAGAPAAAPMLPGLANSTTLRRNPAPSESRPATPPGLTATAPSPNPAGVAMVAEPVAPPKRDAAGNAPASAPAASAPVAAIAPAPATAPPSVPNAAADAPPPVQIATAAPSAPPPRPAVTTGLRAISRDPPDFPKEAIADGLKSGIVSARIHVDVQGNVTGVDILDSQPPKVFDRAVRRALLRWQFEPNAAGQTADVDVKFQRD